MSQPQRIDTRAGAAAAEGNVTLLHSSAIALLCSRECPGDTILQVYDFARLVRSLGRVIVSGFHSAIEKDCLPILLRGPGPIIIVQAHRLSTTRLPIEWQRAIAAGRLLLLSPFSDKEKRVTSDLAEARNRFVAAISDEVLIPYAASGGKTESLALEVLRTGKRVYTFSDRPGKLLEAGAQLVSSDFLRSSILMK